MDRRPIFIVEIPEHAHRCDNVITNSISNVFLNNIPKEEYITVCIPTKNLEWRFSQFDDKNISQEQIDEIKRKVDKLIGSFS